MEFALEYLIKDAELFLLHEFNIGIEKSKLKIYSSESYKDFCILNGFDLNSSGIYVPITYSAYVRANSPNLVSNIFHELYGHGLFTEKSQIGKRLIQLIHEGGDEKSYMLDPLQGSSQMFGIANYNIDNYEGFAVWLESLISQETGNEHIWDLKKKSLREDYARLLEVFKDAENRLTRFGLMSQMGFPKHYGYDKVTDVVRKMYGPEFSNINIIILYGSQKPESDIDLYIVSTNPSRQYYNGWIDISEVNYDDFMIRLRNLDIASTDPLFSGTLIYGNKGVFNDFRQIVMDTQVSPEMIKYNANKSDLQKEYKEGYRDNMRLAKLCDSYSISYARNAEQLALGNKPLTLQNLNIVYAE
ncbi:MAG: hypothetical protein ACMXYL_02205 [Candidatus Woesearchaeota archaeon]